MASNGLSADISAYSFCGGSPLNPLTVPVIAAVGTWAFSQEAAEHIAESCLKDVLMAAPPARTMAAAANESVCSSKAADASCADSISTSSTSTDGSGEGSSSKKTPGPAIGEHLVAGIELVEADPKVHTVGIHSYANAEGVLQLDAAFMNPVRDECGAVLGITGFNGAIRAARAVATKGAHTVLAGAGAEQFLVTEGIARGDPKDPPVWVEAMGSGKEQAPRHDTVGMVALCGKEIVVGCSTSGMKGKHAGRIGDSAIFGSGLYAAAGVGGAAATGDGDVIVKFPFAFVAVEALRAGMTPQHAAQHAIARLAQCPGFDILKSEAAIVVMNMAGEYGYATTHAWEGIFTPSFADIDTLRAREEARAHSRRVRAQLRQKGGLPADPMSPHGQSGSNCAIQ